MAGKLDNCSWGLPNVSVVASIEIKSYTVLLKKKKSYMMGEKSFYFVILGVLTAYYIYAPLPDNVEEPWKIMLLNAVNSTIFGK